LSCCPQPRSRSWGSSPSSSSTASTANGPSRPGTTMPPAPSTYLVSPFWMPGRFRGTRFTSPTTTS
jgi:hypothetical protein